MNKFTTLASITIGGLASVASAAIIHNEDFTGGDGGYTVLNSGNPEGPWTYDGASSWTTNGSDNLGSPSHSRLTSPSFNVSADGPVQLTLTHRYSIESGNWDGAAIFVNLNGGGFTQIAGGDFVTNGYTNTAGLIGNHDLGGGDGFNGDSPGYADPAFIQSVANLGNLTAGDTLEIQFLGAWDEFAKGAEPNWQIDSLSVSDSGAIPEPSAGILLILGLGAPLLRRRR